MADCNSPQKHVWRARIIVLTCVAYGTRAIKTSSGKARISTGVTAEVNLMTQASPTISLSRTRSCAFRTTV